MLNNDFQKTALLASFIDKNELEVSAQKIKENFVIIGSKIFVLKNKNDEGKLVLTYNILLASEKIKFDEHISGTISLHRKKETNTLYTLNALNEVVKEENNGILDKNFHINWKNYFNCILITQKNKGLIKIETELEKIINLENIKVA